MNDGGYNTRRSDAIVDGDQVVMHKYVSRKGPVARGGNWCVCNGADSECAQERLSNGSGRLVPRQLQHPVAA